MNTLLDTNAILSEAEHTHWWYQARRAITERVFWEKLPAKNLKILSVGCGTGAELEHIQQFGNVVGVDIDPQVVSFCRAKGFEVIEADILSTQLPPESFDVVVAMDVLEHIQEDYKALERLVYAVKKGGLLLITVPALECLWSSFDEEGDFPHVRRYTKKSLTDLIRSQSLQIKKLSYYNSFLFPIAYLMRKSNKSFASQMAGIPNWQNTLLRSVFSAEKYFLPRLSFPIGVSLIGIFQK